MLSPGRRKALRPLKPRAGSMESVSSVPRPDTTAFAADSEEDHTEYPRKKRFVRLHPRTARACHFCRRRKARCTGTNPCDLCRTERRRCEYGDDLIRPRPASTASVTEPRSHPTLANIDADVEEPLGLGVSKPRPINTPPQTFASEQHIEPASGVTLLYSSRNADGIHERRHDDIPKALLTSYGDFVPLLDRREGDFTVPEASVLHRLVGQYFGFATPTYRYLHRPSLEQWASQLSEHDKTLSIPKTACVLLTCAQALLYTQKGNRYGSDRDAEMHQSHMLYNEALLLLDRESGPAELASIQARLAMCLYLLCTYRLTACRFWFGLVNTIITSMGLQRKSSTPAHLDLVEIESKRRAFWCSYILDGYLSVMLGRPRLFRDQDIDQPYPRNFDDADLTSLEAPDALPLHGNLEAFLGHAGLARLLARNSDLLYPIESLDADQIFSRTTSMLGALAGWKSLLPSFLTPREKTLSGHKMFERQNTVLKLGHAHLTILITRRCILNDCKHDGGQPPPVDEALAVQCEQECINGISTILTVTHDLLERGTLYQAFWFTQYIAIVAISTLYVLLIQDYSSQLRRETGGRLTEALFEWAKTVQAQISALAPKDSQSGRHFHLLDRLRIRCGKDMARVNSRKVKPRAPPERRLHNQNSLNALRYPTIYPALAQDETRRSPISTPGQGNSELPPADHEIHDLHSAANDMSASAPQTRIHYSVPDTSQFTPSDDDPAFQNLVSWGWESLDTLGFDMGDIWQDLTNLPE